MIPFFNKKDSGLPSFWTDYEKEFRKNLPNEVEKIPFVVLDTETTGFDFTKDRILSIGALTLENNTISINNSLEIFLYQEHFTNETVQIHGILKKRNKAQVSELQALEKLLNYLGNAVIVAHHAYFDISMINAALNRHSLPKLKNKVLDTSHLYKKTLITSTLLQKKQNYSLDEIADKFDISKKDRHTALGDAYITAIAFLKILGRLRKKHDLTLTFLLKSK